MIISSLGKFVALGWGKKETQFHGSEGKQAAHRKQTVLYYYSYVRPMLSLEKHLQSFCYSCNASLPLPF